MEAAGGDEWQAMPITTRRIGTFSSAAPRCPRGPRCQRGLGRLTRTLIRRRGVWREVRARADRDPI